MKQIFTLVTMGMLCLASNSSNAQNVAQSFNTSTEVATLASSCWTFNNFAYSTTDLNGGTGSVLSSLSTTSEIYTPELQIPTSVTISFTYQALQKVNGVSTVKVFLVAGTKETILESININSLSKVNFSKTYTAKDVPGNTIDGMKKVLIRVNQNTSVNIDDLSVNAPYYYTGGCAPKDQIVLPIHILSFQGALNKDKAQLAWSVADNETGNYFEIQKSTDGKNFENASVLFVTGKVGNENYTYTDANTNTAGAFYRLKVYNKDNSTSYSKVVYLKAMDAANNKIMLLQNPVQNSLSFSFTATNSEASEINVYNMVGVKMFSQKLMTQKGTNTITTDCNNKLAKGNYILQISSASGSATTKFIKN